MVIRLTKARGIPVVVVNGRVSPRTFRRYRRITPWLTQLVGTIDLFLMQSEADAARIIELGAPREHVRVVGSLKWDASVGTRPRPDIVQATARQLGLNGTERVIVAGSTHQGEEAAVLDAFDPGVGGARGAVALNADERWFAGPDNGLLSVLAARARVRAYWRITWKPEQLSESFHGRDLFAPIAAAVARGEFPAGKAASIARLGVEFGGTDLGEIIYIDHYGNAFTGLRAQGLPRDKRIVAGGGWLDHARVFSDMVGSAFRTQEPGCRRKRLNRCGLLYGIADSSDRLGDQ